MRKLSEWKRYNLELLGLELLLNTRALTLRKLCARFLNIIWENSWWISGFLKIHWGFLEFLGDSKGFLRILRSQDHGVSRDSAGFCRNFWGFSGLLRIFSKKCTRFLKCQTIRFDISLGYWENHARVTLFTSFSFGSTLMYPGRTSSVSTSYNITLSESHEIENTMRVLGFFGHCSMRFCDFCQNFVWFCRFWDPSNTTLHYRSRTWHFYCCLWPLS